MLTGKESWLNKFSIIEKTLRIKKINKNKKQKNKEKLKEYINEPIIKEADIKKHIHMSI